MGDIYILVMKELVIILHSCVGTLTIVCWYITFNAVLKGVKD